VDFDDFSKLMLREMLAFTKGFKQRAKGERSAISLCHLFAFPGKQEDERTRLDWRHYEAPIPYKKGSLPSEIADKCFALMKSYRLNYSAMDLILTPEGEYVFIENNPAGQCFFIQEHIPEFKMVEAVTSYLLRGNA
jgi:hypothetical protein